MTSRLRTLWLKIHLVLGLTIGLLFAFAGLTGSLIVFDHALDERLNAGMMLTRNQGERKSLQEIVSAAEASSFAPGRASTIAWPRVPDGVFTVSFRQKGEQTANKTIEVFVDPVSTKILGQRERGTGLIATIYSLHSTLLAGKTGMTIMGILAFLVLVSIATGVLLWWPLLKAGFRVAFLIRPDKWNFDLHKTTGILLTPVLFLIAFTGTHLALPGTIRPIVTSILAETKLPQKVKSKPLPSTRFSLTADQAAAVAQATMPGCRLMSVELPSAPDAAFRVFVRQVGEVGDLRGVGRVWVDRYTGEVLATRDWNKFTLADTYFRIQLALHSGDAFGLAGRWLFCAAGLTPTVLYITGFLLWWRKKRSKRRQRNAASRQDATSPEPMIPMAFKS